MQTITQTLLNNLTFLTTVLFFGNLFLKFIEQKLYKVKWLVPLLAGVFAGLIGICMMSFFSIRLNEGTNTVMVDFRQLAIMISFYYGGSWSGLISAVIIGIYRLFSGESLQFSSWIGFGNAMFTYVVTSLCMRKQREVSLKVWFRAIIATLLVYIVAVTILQAIEHIMMNLLFGLLYICAGLFAYYIIRYIQRADDTLMKTRQAANHDFLTKLYNPRAFDRLFRQTIEEAKEQQQSFALVVVDIDFFKKINDNYGHLNGDTVLVQVAEVIGRTIRAGDYCARKGGEEFAIILKDCNEQEALDLAEQIRAAMAQHTFVLEEGQDIHLTISLGVSCYPLTDPTRLFREADRALYEAKGNGRNRVELAVRSVEE
ncbi:GGDEF domain-containing protein [Paenibacillus shenyangensis]|uniref:GGDEF domain-containing protein n=1 Tax=Paenibacillus sp. A9 TaxID=1284352 RepID=UPI00036901BD|nr:diguanylate cyclase [Paenibacillus sp. A9]